MTLKIATGRACCANCGESIPAGVRCIQLSVNSRAAPFLCARCLGRFHRQVEGQTTIIKYEVWKIGDEYAAKREDEDGFVCDLYPQLDEPWGRITLAQQRELGEACVHSIASAEGFPEDRGMACGFATRKSGDKWVSVYVVEFEVRYLPRANPDQD